MARKQLKAGLPCEALAQQGFTLIELLAAVSISVILMMVATSVLVSFMIGNIKSSATRNIKEEGDYALSQMKLQLQNAIKLRLNNDLQECELDMNSVAFEALDGGVTTFFAEPDASDDNKQKIASNSAVYLTSGSANLIDLNPSGDPQYIKFDCVSASNGAGHHITITFGLRIGDPSIDRAYEVSEEYFTTGVTLRNY